MNENVEEITDQLTCPICFLYPDKEVFQCKNGHPICSSCIQRLENCPQCELPLGESPIRCRLMESLLDSVKLPCNNKDAGCTQGFLMKDLPYHHKNCEFRSVSLCKWMGYECDFSASEVTPLIKHLESCHNARKWQTMSWTKRSSQSVGPDCEVRSLYLQECAANCDLEKAEKTWFLIRATMTVGRNDIVISFVPIHLSDGEWTPEHEARFDVTLENDYCTKKLTRWVGYPPKYKDAEKDILFPPFRLRDDHLMKLALKSSSFTDFNFNLKFSVKVKPVLSMEQQIESFNNTLENYD